MRQKKLIQRNTKNTGLSSQKENLLKLVYSKGTNNRICLRHYETIVNYY